MFSFFFSLILEMEENLNSLSVFLTSDKSEGEDLISRVFFSDFIKRCPDFQIHMSHSGCTAKTSNTYSADSPRIVLISE